MSEKLFKTVATNLTDLHREPSFLSELLTQVTNGVVLEVLEEREKWCRARQTDGYEGWAYKPYLCDEPAMKATHMVSVQMAPVYAQSQPTSAGEPVTRLLAGTPVRLVEYGTEGAPWVRIELTGRHVPAGWVWVGSFRELAELPLAPAEARRQMIEDARSLTGTYYLWGGCTCFGIDCSGLAQLAHRLSGYEIPRDARLQFPAGRVVEPPFAPGDLLFFHGESDEHRITHVGISTGGWKMIHSSRSRNGVYEEDVEANENLRRTFAGARSFLK